MLARRSEIARLQSDFYRDYYRRVLRWLIVSVVISFLLALGITYFTLYQPMQTYYASTETGKILPMSGARMATTGQS